MKCSWWTQHRQHEAIVPVGRMKAYNTLLDHYRRSSRSFHLLREDGNSLIEFCRGYRAMSIAGIGSERLFKHRVVIRLVDMAEHQTSISWAICLNIFGFQVASNAIIEECKQLAHNLAEQHAGPVSSEAAPSASLDEPSA